MNAGQLILIINEHTLLVGGLPTPLKNMKVRWGYYSQKLYGKIENVPNNQPDYKLVVRTKTHLDISRHIDNKLNAFVILG
jgi:hypothetical protein